MNILALNAGSSSLKFRIAEPGRAPLFTGTAQDFGTPDARLEIRNADGQAVQNTACAGLPDAARAVLDFAGARKLRLSAIGHRIVHGGPRILAHCVIDKRVEEALTQASALAPLHNPPALDVLALARQMYRDVPQIACLDTAFHSHLPPVAARFPLPAHFFGEGIRRYGFHGLSCESILAQLDPAPQRLVIAHLGGGASVTAVKGGISVDTTMGLTPDGGVIMETRSGDLDPGLLIYLLRQGQTADTLEQLLSKKSGIAGISQGSGDPRQLRASRTDDGDIALDMFAISVAKAIAGMAAALGGIDLLVFTGGIGEHDDSMRQNILVRLNWIADLAIRILPAREEEMIIDHCGKLVSVRE
ncbi:MAG TPA: acetate/propionate family kinase [Rhizomicrobium sp.]|nr:acetate/propionate family kinase [Rhizomicrobium sp.]